MAPSPQQSPQEAPRPAPRGTTLSPAGTTLAPDSIVVSGMSGLYPSSYSVDDLSKILYNKVNPVNKENLGWSQKHPEMPEYIGKIPELDRFDSQFFMVHKRLGEAMDPMARKVLEHSYHAIYDAGLSPKQLNGKKMGVYIATGFSDAERTRLMENPTNKGYGITGISKTMFANRVSYWLNAKGPSMNVDDACCGSVVALEEAVRAIRSGTIESAIVGGTNTCLLPAMLIHFNRGIKLSPDGKTRSFDEHADGCTKSEAISVLFIQKAKHAIRAYAEVVHVKSEFVSLMKGESGQKFGFVRDPAMTAHFLNKFYEEAGVSPTEVEYVEACGSASPEADKAELQSLEKVFCKNRQEPLLVGSVISNVGFTDSASGATALTKVLLGYHTGRLASNLHCSTPRQDVPALQDGRMRVLTEHAPFRRTYAAVNCLSFTGVNAHVLLRGCTDIKDLNRYKSSIPRLVTVSARQHEFIKDIFMSLKGRPIDAEEHALFHNIHSENISGHMGRGYIVLDSNEDGGTVCLSEKIEPAEASARPLWFVYSGMGSQWGGMGAHLMRIPIFAAAIQRCDKVLRPRGIDIVHILTAPDKRIFDNVLNSFVGIAAVQIGLTDVLAALKLKPDNIIGHSVGELGCAYADGCLTAEEMILAAYCRGKASNETTLIPGAMAAVGLGYAQLSKVCPPCIEIACHNSSTSCTISGPVEAVRAFVATLADNGVFAKEVPSAGIAYHSRYIADAAPILLKLLKEVVKQPAARSSRWVSTSVPMEKWGEPAAKYCSPEYLTNNLLSPVLFEETSALIPSNAVLVEVAPHGLLQAILKRALPDSVTNVPLTQRGHQDNAQHLLDAIGKLYMAGFTPRLQEMYPKVQFPVSAGTPHLAQFVKWIHTQTWNVVETQVETKSSSTRSTPINIYDECHSYLTGNVVQGKMVYPFAGALVEVWDTLAMTLGLPKRKVPVEFHDVHFYSQPILYEQKQIDLDISLNRGSGQFEVLQENSKVVTGYVEIVPESEMEAHDVPDTVCDITSEQIYEHLRSRGYSYKDAFRRIKSVDASLSVAEVEWDGNWVTFVEGLLQVHLLRCRHQGVSQVSQLRRLVLDVHHHPASPKLLRAQLHHAYDFTRCGGVLLQNVKVCNLPVTKQSTFDLLTATSAGNDDNMKSIRSLSSGTNYVLSLGTVGDLDTLHWEEAPPEGAHLADTIPVQVEYAGINVPDVNRATGITTYQEADKYFGMDFSGTTMNGCRVMGMVRNGACASRVQARPELVWPVPNHWTLAEAATVPLAYAEAFYYLCVKNELQRGWRVLVHGAAGALGQAAVAVALAHGARVFATVADNNKKRFLLKLFPQLNEDDIGNSRDDSFGDMILNATGGEGCNIVLSCVRGNLKNISLKCAAFSGVTIDMVQIQNRDKFEYGMFNMTKQRSYIAADFYTVLDTGKPSELQRLQLLVSDGIACGFVRPLTHVTYAPSDAARAFRLLAASRHRGRVLLRLRDAAAPVTLRLVCSPEATSHVVWDGSLVALQLVERLIARGAKKICIHTHDTTSHLLQLRLWKEQGAIVEVVGSIVSLQEGGVQSAVSALSRGAPPEGVYVCALHELPHAARLTHNLDQAARQLHTPLKYFVVMSSDSAVGVETCQARARDGYPATALIFPGESVREAEGVRAAVDAAERALRTKHAVLYARTMLHDKLSLRKLLPVLDGPEDGDTTLLDLGLAQSLPTIQYYLRSEHNKSLDDEDVLMLTKKQLLELENKPEGAFEARSGLGVFFDTEQHDELKSSCDMVPMHTLASNIDTMVGGIDAAATHLFVVPGLEGQWGRFRTLCARLKLPALVLQPPLDRPTHTPQQLAHRYTEIMLNKFNLQSNFYILGYEFGIDVALEMAALLEQRGLTGTVYCVGEGPLELRAVLERELDAFPSQAALEEALVRHVCALLGGAPPAAPPAAAAWDARAAAAVRALRGRAAHTAQYVRARLDAARARLLAARTAPPAPRTLRSRLVLLRARTHLPRAPSSLQRYSHRPLEVHELATPLAHAARDQLVPVVINKYLDTQLLEKYEASNSCDTYVLVKI